MEASTRVVVRVRPMNDKERASKQSSVVEIKGNTVQLRMGGRQDSPILESMPPRVFKFDRCYGSLDDSEETIQSSIFQEIGMDLLENAFNGFNCSVFAYGQTGSGKTYTMVGDKTHHGKGLIPRICEALFTEIDARRAAEAAADSNDQKTIFSVQVNYCEIYKEKVKDLLDDSFSKASRTQSQPLSPKAAQEEGKTLKIREHPVHGPFVEGLTTRSVGSYAEIEEELLAGQKLRTVAATLMNPTSSRSHAIFTILFTQTRVDPITLCGHDKTSKICLVDLAGSERSDTSGTSGERLKEAAMINRSLSTLGRVISSLSSNERIPYRDSTLTWLLKESLGGNSKTTMLAMISPSSDNYDETLSTLRYAESAKKIINHVVVNEDKNAAIIRQLRQEIAELREQLEKLPRRRSSESSAGLFASLAEREVMLQQLQKSINNAQKVSLQGRHPSLINLQEDLLEDEPLACTLFPGFSLLGSEPPQNAAEWKSALESFTQYTATNDTNDSAVSPLILTVDANQLLPLHATILNDNGSLSILPHLAADVTVNDIRITSLTSLTHRDRVAFGSSHVYRIHVPSEAALRRKAACDKDNQIDSGLVDDGVDTEEDEGNYENSRATDQELLNRANEICTALDFRYRIEAEGDESYRILLPDGKPSSVVWDKEQFEKRANLLVLLAEGTETADESLVFDDPSLAIKQTDLVIQTPKDTLHVSKPDPFFEVRSNIVRLVGHARLFVGYGISKGHTTSHVKLLKGMSRSISVYSPTGSHIASIAVDLLYELNKGKTGSSILSPRSLSTLTLKVHLKEITFIAGAVSSEGIYATYQLWNQTTKSSTPKVKLTGPSVFDLNHSFTTEVSCSNGKTLEAALDDAVISIDIWGWGDTLPISLTEKAMEIAQLRQKIIGKTPVQSQGDACVVSKPQILPISAKIDVFLSVDIEERNADGIYKPVSVKEDGSLRLQQGYARRVVIRAVQADHQYFCLSGITQVRLCEERTIIKQANHAATTALGSATLQGFFKQYSSEPPSPAKPDTSLEERNTWISLAFRGDSTVDCSTRSVSCVMLWDAISNERRCHRGERRQFRVAVALANELSDTPVILSKTVVAKICPVATTRKLMQRQMESAWWARESYSRAHRLGNWYAIELGASRRLDPLTNSEANSNSLLAVKLLDHYGKGMEKLDVAMMLEKFRQQLLAETETITLLDAKEADLNEICKTKSTDEFAIREISDELFVERRSSPGIFVHVNSGALIDTTDDTTCDPNFSHIVTEPTSTDPYAGDMCGFLALHITNTTELPNSTLNWQRRWFVLQRPLLYCYRSFAKKEVVGVVDILKCQVVAPNNPSLPFTFYLVHALEKVSTVWHIQASTAAELRAWLVAIDPLKIDARESVSRSDSQASALSA